MRSLCIVSMSMLICFAKVTTSLSTIPFNISSFLVRPSYSTMAHTAHITITCILSYLLFKTYSEQKQLKNAIAQEKSKIKKKKDPVTHSYLENEINEGIQIKMDTTARQAGRHFTTAGEGETIKEQLQEYYKDLVALERRVQIIEQKISELLKSEKSV